MQYLKDNDESRRLGTFLVFVDEGIAKDEPLLAVPINLSVLLDLPQDEVMGMTRTVSTDATETACLKMNNDDELQGPIITTKK